MRYLALACDYDGTLARAWPGSGLDDSGAKELTRLRSQAHIGHRPRARGSAASVSTQRSVRVGGGGKRLLALSACDPGAVAAA